MPGTQAALDQADSPATADDADEPEWQKHVNNIQKQGCALHFFNVLERKNFSQQLKGQCIFCNQTITSTGAVRLAEHLQDKCAACPTLVRHSFLAVKERKCVKRKFKEEQVTSAREEMALQAEKAATTKEQAKQQGIRVSFKAEAAELADKAIAKFFYANGLPFSAASHEADSYYRDMISSIQKASSSYVPPGANALSNSLLDACHKDMQAAIAARDPHGNVADKFGCTYVSDGWDDVSHHPLINSAYVMANNGGTYLRSVDTSGFTKDASYLAQLMIDDIYQIGPANVIAVCTDTCNSMKAAWRKVEAEFPWMFIVPCQAHCASLLAKDIGGISEVAQTVKEENTISGWFTNHQKPLAILRDVTKNLLKKSLELKKAAATRFGSHTLVGERQLELKNCLQAAIVHPDYVSQGYKDEADTVDQGSGYQTVRECKGGTVKRLVLDDADGGFWDRVKNHVDLTLPVLKLIRRHDSSAPSVGKAYHGWFEVGENIQESRTTYSAEAKDKFDSRWSYAHCALFSAAYVLDPEFVDHDQASNEEVMLDFLDATEKIGMLMAVKEDVANGKYKLAKDNLERGSDGKPTCFPTVRDPRVQQFCTKVNAQLSLYRGKKGIFDREYVFAASAGMPSHLWWEQYGCTVPQLQSMAMLVLSQPGSASVCERINSEFAFVVDKRRNRLKHEKADKLVGLFHNLRLLRKMNRVKYAEPIVGWGEGKIESFGL